MYVCVSAECILHAPFSPYLSGFKKQRRGHEVHGDKGSIDPHCPSLTYNGDSKRDGDLGELAPEVRDQHELREADRDVVKEQVVAEQAIIDLHAPRETRATGVTSP